LFYFKNIIVGGTEITQKVRRARLEKNKKIRSKCFDAYLSKENNIFMHASKNMQNENVPYF